MTSLATLIAPSGPMRIVTGGTKHHITRPDLLTQTLTPDSPIGLDTRAALFIDDPVNLIRAIVALDGQISGMLLLSHALDAQTVVDLARASHCNVIVSDKEASKALPHGAELGYINLDDILSSKAPKKVQGISTQWLMTTSGTTGLPKVVPYALKSLARSVYHFGPSQCPVWGLFYDPTRFAGLQVVLQALIGGGRLVAVDTTAPLRDQIALLVSEECTHLSATPTLWRRILMVPEHSQMPLRQITLGGEIADNVTMMRLRGAFPEARISHIYASTEAGVGFSVKDEKAGFPISYLEAAPGNVALKVKDGILWLRPPGKARPGTKVDVEGYINSGDKVVLEDDRVLFQGRESGLINIGGVKVYPETVEDVIKTVPGVALVQISAKKSSVTGALVVAEVQVDTREDPSVIRKSIQQACKAALPREANPAIIRFVEGFEINAAGKLMRKKE